MFDDDASFARVARSGVLSAANVAPRYGVDPGQVRVVALANARAIKISLPRPVSAGSPSDADCLGGQQYAPLLDIEVP